MNNYKQYNSLDYATPENSDAQYKKLALIFKIVDHLKYCDFKNETITVLTLHVPHNCKEILGIINGLSNGWVIDYILEEDEIYHLIYRNCITILEPFSEEVIRHYLYGNEQRLLERSS